MKYSQDKPVAWVFGASGVIGQEVTRELIAKKFYVVAFVFSRTAKLKDFNDNDSLKIVQADLRNLDISISLIDSLTCEEWDPTVIYFCSRGKPILDETLRNATSFNNELVDDYVISVLSPTIISLKLIDTSRRLKRIIFLSSQYAQVAQIPSLYDKPELALSSVYSALKGAVLSLARALSIGAIAKGINVNVFTVGGIRESTGEILAQRIEEKIPSSGMLSAPEVARAIVHISEVFGLGMVGSNVVIDGGWTAI